jgi:hypothetical protein
VAGLGGLELGNVDFLKSHEITNYKSRPNSLVFQNILVPETFRVSPAPTPEGSAHDFRTERLCAQIVSGIHPEQHPLALT